MTNTKALDLSVIFHQSPADLLSGLFLFVRSQWSEVRSNPLIHHFACKLQHLPENSNVVSRWPKSHGLWTTDCGLYQC
jgi:hypothetical protein